MKKISDKQFIKILKKAVKGNIIAIYEIIDIYKDVIISNSIIDGSFSPECRDYIEEKIIREIKKFRKI